MATVSMIQSPAEAHTRDAYLALMWSLSYPGRSHPLPSGADAGAAEGASHPAFLSIATTLLDLETSFYCADDGLAKALDGSGARRKPADQAAYVFLTAWDDAALDVIERVSVGTFTYPDGSATIIVSATFDAGQLMTWSGPGIQSPRRVLLAGVPDAFWSVRAQRVQYPLGFDVFFVDRGRVMGLPRTTHVQLDGEVG